MIEVQMRLYKTDGVIPPCICYFLVVLTISKSLQDTPKSAMRSRDMKIQIFNEDTFGK